MPLTFIELTYYDSPLGVLKNEKNTVFLPIDKIERIEPVMDSLNTFAPGEISVVSAYGYKYIIRVKASDFLMGLAAQIDNSVIQSVEFERVGNFEGEKMRFFSF